MPVLQYDFAVIGEQKINAALASLERKFAQHSQRVDRMMGARSSATTGTGRARSGAGLSDVDREQRRQAQYWANAQRGSARFREQQERRVSAEQIKGTR